MKPAPWYSRTPDLIADVRLYPPADGGRNSAIELGFECLCFASADRAEGGWFARPLLGHEPFAPGTERRVGLVFLTAEGVQAMAQAGRFYLWEGRFIGEATVVG